MDMTPILDQLRAERARVDAAITAMESIISGDGDEVRPAGRKKAPKRAKAAPKRHWSKAARKATSLRMKKYWAARRKEGVGK